MASTKASLLNKTDDLAAKPSTTSVSASSEASAPIAVQKPTGDAEDEDDLDDLDDLLDDFADDVLKQAPGAASAASELGKTAQTANANELNVGIEDLIKDLQIEDADTKKQFEELVKQFDTNHRELAENPASFDNVMKEAMLRLKQLGQNIDEQIKSDQVGANADDMLNQLLLGLGGGADGNLDMLKLLVDMLEQLLLKEVLYEPIKDLNSKFPEYLEENKSTLAEDKHSTYVKQYNLTTEILAIFEAPNYTDDDKQKRSEVNTLLEKLQELGQPPLELVGDALDFPGFGGGNGSLDFNDGVLPKNLEKELEEGCPQQ